MADALIAQLSELPDIAVSPLSSVAKHTRADEDPIESGGRWECPRCWRARCRRRAIACRVTSRLLRVSDGHTLWSGRFDEKVTGIFQVQDSIAGLVMLTLAEQLGMPPPQHHAKRSTLNTEAYQLYASGIYNWLRRDIDGTDASVADFKAAIREDPDYALAWSSLAGVLCAQSAFGIKPAAAVLPEAKVAAQHAIDLDSELAEAHAAMGHVLVQLEQRYAEGERYYRRARELNPNLGFARLWSSINFLHLGRPDDALAQARRAQELEPGNLAFSANVGRMLYYSRQYEAAIAHLDRLLTLMPTLRRCAARYPVARCCIRERWMRRWRNSRRATGPVPAVSVTWAGPTRWPAGQRTRMRKSTSCARKLRTGSACRMTSRASMRCSANSVLRVRH